MTCGHQPTGKRGSITWQSARDWAFCHWWTVKASLVSPRDGMNGRVVTLTTLWEHCLSLATICDDCKWGAFCIWANVGEYCHSGLKFWLSLLSFNWKKIWKIHWHNCSFSYVRSHQRLVRTTGWRLQKQWILNSAIQIPVHSSSSSSWYGVVEYAREYTRRLVGQSIALHAVPALHSIYLRILCLAGSFNFVSPKFLQYSTVY